MDLRIGDTVANPTTGKTARVEKILHQKARLSDSTWHALDALMPLQSIPNGLPPQKSPRLKSGEYVEILSELGYRFSMSTMDNRIYVNGAPLDEAQAACIRARMSDVGHTRFGIIEDAYTMAASENQFHVVRDYLNALEWDGNENIKRAAAYITDSDEMFYYFLRNWMVGAVAKAFTGCQNPMLVLSGDQGMGKSFFVRWLCPIPGMHIEQPIRPDAKDDMITLISKWVWEVGELGGTTRRTDRDALKHFLTIEEVTVRVPYEKHPINKKALASFIGTVNPDAGGFLDDPSGLRRFVVCDIKSIDFGYTGLSVAQMWAEAVAAYNANENWRMMGELKRISSEINERHIVSDPIEDLLEKAFVIDAQETEWFVPTTDILEVLHAMGWRLSTPKGEAMAVSMAAQKLGAVKPVNKVTHNGIQVRGMKCMRRRI